MKLRSSWIEDIKYRPGTFIIPANESDSGPLIGHNALAIWTDRGDALLYVGKTPESLPSWISGLLQAGMGGRSVGRAYHKLLKGRPEDVWYQRLEGPEKVYELRKMFKV